LAEERVALTTAEEASRRLAFLAEASATLRGSLDFAAITRELVRLCVPAVGDVCALTLVVDVPENRPMELLFPDPVGQRPDAGLSGRMVSAAAKPWLSEAIERVQQTGKAGGFASPEPNAAARDTL